ncbi:hypothetical protein [Paraburkholderia sp. HP33-1]|uniref:hypothetical protein n=1 Tax=Paraburkholderia sp. HP33-1 TaxID=2883243 RepID=UPI001F1661EB|nr:hypothetical protein [Paraburkholderia sp. HP33-1]
MAHDMRRSRFHHLAALFHLGPIPYRPVVVEMTSAAGGVFCPHGVGMITPPGKNRLTGVVTGDELFEAIPDKSPAQLYLAGLRGERLQSVGSMWRLGLESGNRTECRDALCRGRVAVVVLRSYHGSCHINQHGSYVGKGFD